MKRHDLLWLTGVVLLFFGLTLWIEYDRIWAGTLVGGAAFGFMRAALTEAIRASWKAFAQELAKREAGM